MTESASQGPIWQKRVSDRQDLEAGRRNVRYCAGRDVQGLPPCDLALVPHDLATNAAHAIMLAEAGILSKKEKSRILSALLSVRDRFLEGGPVLDPECEDVHMSIESLVSEEAGSGAGGRLHTGRSRNDQVATDMRLWLREETVRLAAGIGELGRKIAEHAERHAAVPCPGMTHMQPAMVTTWGHWVASYLPRLARDLRAFIHVIEGLEECPLGAAASFGTSWPINRERTAQLLGFGRPSCSSLDVIWSRGEVEARFVFALAQHLAHLAGIGQDLILLSSPPRQWIRLPDEAVTGSSIMPQKRNPDFAEVTRAKAAVVAGHVQALLGITQALPGGYNRDTQWTKYIVMDAAWEAREAPSLFSSVIDGLEVSEAAMHQACREGFLAATDVADFLSRKRNIPFREAYRLLGQSVKECEREGFLALEVVNRHLEENGHAPIPPGEWSSFEDPRRLIELRRHTGGPGPEEVRRSVQMNREEIDGLAVTIRNRAEQWSAALDSLWELAEKESAAG